MELEPESTAERRERAASVRVRVRVVVVVKVKVKVKVKVRRSVSRLSSLELASAGGKRRDADGGRDETRRGVSAHTFKVIISTLTVQLPT
jgi:hypothetical protein